MGPKNRALYAVFEHFSEGARQIVRAEAFILEPAQLKKLYNGNNPKIFISGEKRQKNIAQKHCTKKRRSLGLEEYFRTIKFDKLKFILYYVNNIMNRNDFYIVEMK